MSSFRPRLSVDPNTSDASYNTKEDLKDYPLFSLQTTHEQPSTASTFYEEEYDKKLQINTYRQSTPEQQIIEEDNYSNVANATYQVDNRKSFFIMKNKGSNKTESNRRSLGFVNKFSKYFNCCSCQRDSRNHEDQQIEFQGAAGRNTVMNNQLIDQSGDENAQKENG